VVLPYTTDYSGTKKPQEPCLTLEMNRIAEPSPPAAAPGLPHAPEPAELAGAQSPQVERSPLLVAGSPRYGSGESAPSLEPSAVELCLERARAASASDMCARAHLRCQLHECSGVRA
jgi:hypothetical protein